MSQSAQLGQTQQQQQQNHTMPMSSDARMSALETRVDGLAGTLNSVVSAVNSLGDKIDKRSATPWGVIWTALATIAGVITMVGGLAYYPIKESQSDLKGTVLLIQEKTDRRLESIAGSQVSRAEHEVHWRQQDRESDNLRERINKSEEREEKRIDALGARIDRLEAKAMR